MRTTKVVIRLGSLAFYNTDAVSASCAPSHLRLLPLSQTRPALISSCSKMICDQL